MSVSKIAPNEPTPALFTKMSRCPELATAVSMRPWITPGSQTSATTATALPPAAAIRSVLSFIAVSVLPQRTTWAPAAPRLSAIALPIPLDDPVTTAVRSFRSGEIVTTESSVVRARLSLEAKVWWSVRHSVELAHCSLRFRNRDHCALESLSLKLFKWLP